MNYKEKFLKKLKKTGRIPITRDAPGTQGAYKNKTFSRSGHPIGGIWGSPTLPQ